MKTAIRSLATSAIVLFLCVSQGTAEQSFRDNVSLTTGGQSAKTPPSISLYGEGKNNPAVIKPGAVPAYDAAFSSSEDVGDVNLNGVPNEVADAVLFSKYFIYGLQVFRIDQAAQIMQTDTNADGLTLSVSDLVYQIGKIE